jgi:hypothetical protein
MDISMFPDPYENVEDLPGWRLQVLRSAALSDMSEFYDAEMSEAEILELVEALGAASDALELGSSEWPTSVIAAQEKIKTEDTECSNDIYSDLVCRENMFTNDYDGIGF